MRRLRRIGIDYADQYYQKLKVGKVPWSKMLQLAHDTINLWQRVLSRSKGMAISTRLISRLERKAEVSNSMHNSIPVI